jgi:hypothetical protein
MSAATTMGYSTFSDKDLDSCLKQDTSERNNLNLFKQGILREDAIELSMQMMNSQGPGYYQLDNQNGCECGLKEARDIQVSQPGINFKGGCGWSGELGCLTDNDSHLRQNKDRITNKREIHQLTERLSATTRNLSKGFYDVDAESVIRPGDFGKDQKPCMATSEITIGNYFTPMIPKLKTEVQNTKHIIPEDSEYDWVRGGLPTREMVRNEDYLRRCKEKTFKDQDKN